MSMPPSEGHIEPAALLYIFATPGRGELIFFEQWILIFQALLGFFAM